MRAATSVQNDPASPWPASAATITATAASVTRRAPTRSPIAPAGTDTSTIAMLALARRMPERSGESENRVAKAGTSGTIAIHRTSPTNSDA